MGDHSAELFGDATMDIMKRVSVSDLRHDFDPVERGLRRGKSFEITKYGRVVAILDPPVNRKGTQRTRPRAGRG
jgi:hypothetical protein